MASHSNTLKRSEGCCSGQERGMGIGPLLSVDEALMKLEEDHARCGQIVSLRFFAGLSMPEVAEVVGVSLATAERDWRFARSWLQKELGRSEL